MPIYEFECSECGDQFERLQKLSDPDPTICPKCGAEKIKRRLTAPSFRLAGSGWYETDFKKDGDRKRNLAAKDDAPKPDTQADTGAKDKSAEKPAGTAAETRSDKAPTAKPKSEGTAST